MDSAPITTVTGMTEPLQFRGHIAALDGLRGIAILMVLLRHFYLEVPILTAYPTVGPWLTKLALAGNYGVELFFVLSGFLITGILVDSRSNSNYFSAFYMRRFLRIFPLYYATLCVVLIILPRWVDFDSAGQSIVSRQVWLWSYLSNAPWSGGGWDGSAIFRLGHFWSLCVEEHFYTIWPIVVYLILDKHLKKLCVIGLIGCLLLRLISLTSESSSFLGWSSISKLDGLLMGSLLAVGVRSHSLQLFLLRISDRARIPLFVAFAGLLIVPRRLEHTWWCYGPTESIAVLLFGSITMLALQPATTFSSMLKNPVLRGFGKYSYGIYVIHNILLPAFDAILKPLAFGLLSKCPIVGQVLYWIATITSSCLLAALSWHLMEKHFLSLKSHYEYRSTPA